MGHRVTSWKMLVPELAECFGEPGKPAGMGYRGKGGELATSGWEGWTPLSSKPGEGAGSLGRGCFCSC